MKYVIWIAFLIINFNIAFAQLGRTPDQMASKYGQPINKRILDENIYINTYNAAGLSLIVHFCNGKVGGIIYSKNDHEDFANEEIIFLLGVNGGNGSWVQSKRDKMTFKNEWGIYANDRLQIYARYDRGQLQIETMELRRLLDVFIQKDAANYRDSF